MLSEEVQQEVKGMLDEWIELNFSCRGLPHTGGKMYTTDPKLEIMRARAHIWEEVYHSETIYDKKACPWNPMILHVNSLCHNDKNREVMFRVTDHNEQGKWGKDETIGTQTMTVNTLLSRLGADIVLTPFDQEGKYDGNGGILTMSRANPVLEITNAVMKLEPSRLFHDDPDMFVKLW
jgi:hypothetical protein